MQMERERERTLRLKPKAIDLAQGKYVSYLWYVVWRPYKREERGEDEKNVLIRGKRMMDTTYTTCVFVCMCMRVRCVFE